MMWRHRINTLDTNTCYVYTWYKYGIYEYMKYIVLVYMMSIRSICTHDIRGICIRVINTRCMYTIRTHGMYVYLMWNTSYINTGHEYPVSIYVIWAWSMCIHDMSNTECCVLFAIYGWEHDSVIYELMIYSLDHEC